ncbi:MAG: hypothetical protein GXX90_02750 [Microbacteriaceae bacterium]|nr:hypothetical protein [Microbacteriaceae bacterium]
MSRRRADAHDPGSHGAEAPATARRRRRNGIVMLVIGGVLLLAASALAFAAGYEVRRLLGEDAPGWARGFVSLAQWVTGIAGVFAWVAGMEALRATRPDAERRARRRSRLGVRGLVGLLMLWPAAYGVGVLLRPAVSDLAADDRVRAWFFVILGVGGAIAFELQTAKGVRTARHYEEVRARGTDTIGVVVASRVIEDDGGGDIASPLVVEFVDAAGATRRITRRVAGNVPVGARMRLRYVHDDPRLPPVLGGIAAP